MADGPAERTGRIEMLLEASGFFAIVYPNHTYCMGLSAQLTMVTKAGGLRTKCVSLAVLHRHHKLCGQGVKDELLWRV